VMQGPEAIVAVVFFASVGGIGYTLARAFAKRIAGGAVGAKEVEALRDEVAQLRAEVDQLHDRVAPVDEIQNRLDFAERLLAQARERGQLSAPRGE
jgi:cell division protein FtsB